MHEFWASGKMRVRVGEPRPSPAMRRSNSRLGVDLAKVTLIVWSVSSTDLT